MPRFSRPPRKLSNEEILLARMRSHGSLELLVMFYVKDTDGKQKAMKGREIKIRGVPNQGSLLGLIEQVREFIICSQAGKNRS